MWNPDDYPFQHASFAAPVPDPGTEPGAAPLVCVRFNKDWLHVVLGCLMQLMQGTTWDVANDTLRQDVLDRSMLLLNIFGTAGVCVPTEDGLVSITILAGDGTASLPVVFTGLYTVAPNILVSCDAIALAATYSDVTLIGCNVHLTASVPVIADTTAHVSWAALT